MATQTSEDIAKPASEPAAAADAAAADSANEDYGITATSSTQGSIMLFDYADNGNYTTVLKSQLIHSQTLPFLQGINLPLGTELTEYCSFTSEEYARRAQVEQLLSIGESIKMAYTLEENYNWYMGLVGSEADLIISDKPRSKW